MSLKLKKPKANKGPSMHGNAAQIKLFEAFLTKEDLLINYIQNLKASQKIGSISYDSYVMYLEDYINQYGSLYKVLDRSFTWSHTVSPGDLSSGRREQLWADLNNQFNVIITAFITEFKL